jgi:hypothetical protein
MSIQDWGAIGEAVGGAAVLVTLVYLALQLRRTSRVAHRQTYNAGAEAISRFLFELAENPGLHLLYRRSLQEPEKLEKDELLQGHTVIESYFSLMEGYYLHNFEYGEKLAQERWSRVLRRLLSMPGGSVYWAQNRWKFHAEFAKYIDSLQTELKKP